MSVAFWSVQLKAGKPVEVQPPEGYVLNLQLAALHGETEKCAVVKVDTLAIEGDPMSAVVCTLRSKTTDQCTLNLVFGYDVSTKFSFTGDKQSTVYLSGYYQPAPEDMGSDDEFDGEMSEEEDSEEDEEAIITKAATKANASKMQIPEDDEDSEDDDEELEEDSVDEEFIKKMIQQNRAGGDDSEDSEDEEEEDSEEEESEEEAPPAKVIKTTPGKKAVPAQKTPQRPATAPAQKTPQSGGFNKNGNKGKQPFSNQKSGEKRKR